jgi:hypothetical protein
MLFQLYRFQSLYPTDKYQLLRPKVWTTALSTPLLTDFLSFRMFFLAGLSVFVHLVAAGDSCYFVNGQTAPDHTPCFPDREISPCCLMNQDNPDVCLESGLCLSFGGTLYQSGCTDETSAYSNCTHFCPDGMSTQKTSIPNCYCTSWLISLFEASQ